MGAEILLVVALLPLVAVAATAVPPIQQWATRLSPLSALPALILSLGHTWSVGGEVSWLFLGAQLELDDAGRLFLLATSFVWLVSAIFANSFPVKGDRRRFLRFFYATMAGNFLLIISADIITFLVGFSLMSYAGYGLVVQKSGAEARRAARIYMILVVFAEILLLAGTLLAWGISGSWELIEVRRALGEGGNIAVASMAMIFAGFGVKAGLVPLHIWLPLAHPAAPVAASAVLSAAMIKAGLLGWIRFLPFGADGLTWLGWWALAAGMIAAFAGVFVGLLQSRPKTILAYSSISQMGYMTILLALAALAPELTPAIMTALLVYVIHHAVAKGALFLSVGVAREAPHRWWWRILEGVGLVVPALALAGAPLTTGAIAKAQLKTIPYVAEGDLPVFVDPALIIGALATTILMARFLWVVWPRSRRTKPVSLLARGVWILIATSALWGPWLIPWDLLRDAVWATLEPGALRDALWPIILGTILSVIVLRRSHLFPFTLEDYVPAGDVLVPLSYVLVRIHDLIGAVTYSARQRRHEKIRRVGHWLSVRSRHIEVLETLEARIQKQAWHWVWILFVGAILLATLIL